MSHQVQAGILFGLVFTLGLARAHADDLTVQIYPSPYDINWNSPQELTRSVVLSALAPNIYPEQHEIGHETIELSCDSAGEEEVYELTGMTDTGTPSDLSLLLQKELGLGILFFDFPGRLQTEAEVQKDLDARYRYSEAVKWIHFDISSSTCQRLELYLSEYRVRGYMNHYGLNLRPRYGEGAGCSAFAVSFLDLAGLLSPEFTQAWSKTIEVPLDLIGNLADSKVSLATLLFSSKSKSWGAPDSDGRTSRSIFFWDPDMMFEWVKSQASHYPSEQKGAATGIYVDARDVPTPTDPIWK